MYPCVVNTRLLLPALASVSVPGCRDPPCVPPGPHPPFPSTGAGPGGARIGAAGRQVPGPGRGLGPRRASTEPRTAAPEGAAAAPVTSRSRDADGNHGDRGAGTSRLPSPWRQAARSPHPDRCKRDRRAPGTPVPAPSPPHREGALLQRGLPRRMQIRWREDAAPPGGWRSVQRSPHSRDRPLDPPRVNAATAGGG